MIAFTNILLTISSLALSALSIPLKSRDVVDPPITSPMAGTVWHVGESQLVTWNTEGLPSNPSNPVGMLVLGYMYNNSENLMLGSPLATNIDYALGQVQITVPKVETREDYIVVLFGDSGNASPEFTIINDSSSVSASVVSTTASSIQSTNPTTGSASSTFTTEIPTSSPSPCTTSSTSTGGSTLLVVHGEMMRRKRHLYLGWYRWCGYCDGSGLAMRGRCTLIVTSGVNELDALLTLPLALYDFDDERGCMAYIYTWM